MPCCSLNVRDLNRSSETEIYLVFDHYWTPVTSYSRLISTIGLSLLTGNISELSKLAGSVKRTSPPV